MGKRNLFIQFQDKSDLFNINKLNKNMEDIKSSKLLYKKILSQFNIYAFIKENPKFYHSYQCTDNTVYISSEDQENNINTSLFDLGLENILLTINSSNSISKYTLYDDVNIFDNQITNALNPKEDINKYYYSSLDEVYEHLNYMYILGV